MATVEFYSKAQVDAKIPSAAQLVPTTSGATSGDVLTFDGSSVGWTAAGGGLPDPTSAAAGDVLTLDSSKNAVWQTPSGGRTVTSITNWSGLQTFLANCKVGDCLIGNILGSDVNNFVQHFSMVCTQVNASGMRSFAIANCEQQISGAAKHYMLSECFYTPSTGQLYFGYMTSYGSYSTSNRIIVNSSSSRIVDVQSITYD